MLACLLVQGGDARAMSLQEAVDTAVKTNPKIESAQANQRASQHVLGQATSRFFPEVQVGGTYGAAIIDRPNGLGPEVNDQWRNPRRATVSVRQTLFAGWDRVNDVWRSRSIITSASYRVLVRSEAVALSSIEAYIDVMRHDELLGLAYAHVKRLQVTLGLIQERFKGGKAPVGDVEQTIERIEAAKALVAQIKVARETAAAKFKNAVGIPPSDLEHVAYATGIPTTVTEVVRLSVENNPRVRAAIAEIDVAYFDKKRFLSTLLPEIYIEGSATRGENLDGTPGKNNNFEAKVGLSWKLFDGGVRRSREAELSERQTEKMADQLVLVRQLTEEAETAWSRLVDGRAQVDAIKVQVAQTTKVVNTYKDEYNADKRSLLDLLDAENARFGAQFELSNVTALHVFASYQLLAHMGSLLSTLGVAAPRMAEVRTGFTAPFPDNGPAPRFSIPPLSFESSFSDE